MPGLVRPADGDFGLFRFDTGTRAMALINHQAGQPTAIALGGGTAVQIAPDGEALLFVNTGSELVAGQTGSGRQTFAYDVATGAARLVSHAAGNPLAGALGEPAALSADHRFAAFGSTAPNLVAGDRDDGLYDAFLYDLEGPAVQRLSSAAAAGLRVDHQRFPHAGEPACRRAFPLPRRRRRRLPPGHQRSRLPAGIPSSTTRGPEP